MLRSSQLALRATLSGGPAHCPPDLFVGDAATIIRGLRVHANQINHSRHVALEETLPRLRARIGAEAFHAAADRHLDGRQALGARLDQIGAGFDKILPFADQRDLAAAELAWLESYHSAEAEPLGSSDIALLVPEDLLVLRVQVHPAARWHFLEAPESFRWDAPVVGEGSALLFTRPLAEVEVRRVEARDLTLLDAARERIAIDDLLALANSPNRLLALIATGTLTAEG
jgi:hypothetical protein